MFNVVYRMPQRPTAVDPELPKRLDAALAVGLAKSPEDRFQTAGALARALVEVDGEQALYLRAHAVLRKSPWGHPEREEATGALRLGSDSP